jgi:hypothetical protein
MAGTPLAFGGFDMNSSTIITSELDDGNEPERELSIHNLIGTGGIVISGDGVYYRKTILAKGSIQGTSSPYFFAVKFEEIK